jgi:hypothetical protein
MPTFWPGSISNVKSFKTIAVFGLYLNETFLKWIFPLWGHPSGNFSPSYFSCGIFAA